MMNEENNESLIDKEKKKKEELHLSVILPNKQNNDLYISILSQLGKNDDLIAFELAKFPVRKIEDAINSAKNGIIIFISPYLPSIPNNFIKNIKENCKEGFTYIKDTHDDMGEGYTTGDYSNYKKFDCIWFHKRAYRKARLRDFSSQMDYEGVMKTLLKIIRQKIYIPKTRITKKSDTDKSIKNEIQKHLKDVEKQRKMDIEARKKKDKELAKLEQERKRVIEERRLMKKAVKRMVTRDEKNRKKRVPLLTPKPTPTQRPISNVGGVYPIFIPVEKRSVLIEEIMLED